MVLDLQLYILGSYWDYGKEHGNYYNGSYRECGLGFRILWVQGCIEPHEAPVAHRIHCRKTLRWQDHNCCKSSYDYGAHVNDTIMRGRRQDLQGIQAVRTTVKSQGLEQSPQGSRKPYMNLMKPFSRR